MSTENHETNIEQLTPLEALRPVVDCDNAELLRFFNFTTALGEWWRHRKRYLAEQNPQKSREIGYWLYHHTVDVQLRIYRYEAVPRNGSHYHLDREFMALFPKAIPMSDGTLMEWPHLLKSLKHLKECCASAAYGLKTT